jgi:hypothetical protein
VISTARGLRSARKNAYTQLAQTLVDSHGPLVVITTVGSLRTLAVVVTTPALNQVFGCTPVDPSPGVRLLAAAAASSVSALALGLLARATETVRRQIINGG